ncbi:MAG: FecR domain-containing protein [Gammaproteobacteria bacterium]|nr:FecR domain-containing protein [Gammaproteobacteria bacterium]
MVMMMRGPFLSGLLALSLLLASMSLLASDPVGRVVLARGDATALAADGSSRALARRDEVLEGDTLVTGAGAALQVRFDDGGVLSLRGDTRIELAVYRSGRPAAGPDRILLRALQGAIRTITGTIARQDPSAFEVETPVASIGIRGTHFEAAQESANAWIIGVWDGGIRVYNEHGAVNLGRDAEFLYARARAGRAPEGLVVAPEGFGEGIAGGGTTSEATEVASAAAGTEGAGVADDGGTRLAAQEEGVRLNPGEDANDLQTLLDLADRSISELFALSEAERRQLDTMQPSALLMGLLPDGSIVAGRGATADDGSALVAFTLPDGREAVLRGGGAPVTSGDSRVGGFDVTWGRFARPAPGEGPILLVGPNGEAQAAVLRDDLTFVVVGDVRVADLNVKAAFRGDQAIGRASGGEFTDFDVFFNAVVDLGEGRIRDGHLLLQVGGGAEEFRVAFAGAVRGGHAELDVTSGTISGFGVGGTVEVDRVGSDIQGLFTREAEGFVGGFSLRELGNRDRFAEGAFVAKPVDD